MTRTSARWAAGLIGALLLHVAVLGMVPWSREEALSERSAGEEADVWGAPTSTILMELVTVESVAGETPEATEAEPTEVVENATSPEVEPVETSEAEPVETSEAEPVEAQEVAAIEPREVQEVEPVEAKPVQAREAEPAPRQESQVVAAVDPISPLEPVSEEAQAVEAEVPTPAPSPKPKQAQEKPVTPEKPKVAKTTPKKPEPERRSKQAPKPAKEKAPQEQAARTRTASRTEADAGNAKRSASAASGVAKGNRGTRQANPGWSNRSNYAGRILAHLQRHKHYPEDAARRGLTGVATLTFSIAANGQLKSVRLRGSSGIASLDEAAIATVRRASPFPPIPAEAQVSAMTFTVPLRYKRP